MALIHPPKNVSAAHSSQKIKIKVKVHRQKLRMYENLDKFKVNNI